MNPSLTERSTDGELWELVRLGSEEAFAVLVRKHQSLVCAVAYNACGNVALSEDVAQETFWAAWRGRDSPEPPTRLRPWLCGIARNLARNAGRRAGRPVEAAAPLDGVAEPSMIEPGPLEAALSREEEALVWKTLARIPESYREPLILFYREGQSVAEVASALDLSEDAAKQRLSRGRAMLRERMSGLVEEGLRRTRPGRSFTVAVLSGLTAGSAGVKTASAAGIAGSVTKAGIGGALSAGALGSIVGLAGGWLGIWAPAQMAPSIRERDQILRVGRRMLLMSIAFLAALYGLIWLFAGQRAYIVAWAAWFLAFQIYIWVEVFRLNRAIQRIQLEAGPNPEPNNSAVRLRMNALSATRRGRVFQTRARFLGWPLIDINVSDPVAPNGEPIRLDMRTGSKVARGWIAVGDHARGLLVAVGSTAVGPIALGIDRAYGLISFGGIAVGLIAIGGLALGGVAIGGLGVGVLGIGGLGVGVLGIGGLGLGIWAAGGGAIAWKVAVGGLAVARQAAFGGTAFASDNAVGGGGWASHFNDDQAKALLLNHPLKLGMDWFVAHQVWAAWWFVPVVLLVVLLPFLIIALKFRRERQP